MYYDENKPLGFEILDSRYGITIHRTRTAMWRLQRYLAGEIDHLQELADERLYRHMAPSFDTQLCYISLITGGRISHSIASTMSDKSGKKRRGEMPVFT